MITLVLQQSLAHGPHASRRCLRGCQRAATTASPPRLTYADTVSAIVDLVDAHESRGQLEPAICVSRCLCSHDEHTDMLLRNEMMMNCAFFVRSLM